MTSVAGIDGAGERWVAVVAPADPAPGAPAGVHQPLQWVLGDIGEVLAVTDQCAAVAVDVPIGMVPSGSRACEAAARSLLGPDARSVFPTPPAPAMAVARREGATRSTRARAQAASRAVGGSGISTQSWGLASKILDVEDELRRRSLVARGRVVETHPETAFRVMADQTRLRQRAWPAKRSAAGVGRRLAAVGAAVGVGPESLDDAALAGVGIDDAVDALAALWTARRVASGTAWCLGREDGPRAVWSDGTPAPDRAVIWV